jgi:hypothetical protein
MVLVVMFDMTGWSLASDYVVSIRATLQADPPSCAELKGIVMTYLEKLQVDFNDISIAISP